MGTSVVSTGGNHPKTIFGAKLLLQFSAIANLVSSLAFNDGCVGSAATPVQLTGSTLADFMEEAGGEK
jgi:hypothetical protein